MTPFSLDYIIPGDVFSDETVLCMRCATQIMRLSYKEMPKINAPEEIVNVAHKMKLGNYRQLPVILYRKGKQQICNILLCQECVKETVPELNSDQIITQLKRALHIEARWAGLPDESIDGINRQFADARILRKLTSEEITQNRILEAV